MQILSLVLRGCRHEDCVDYENYRNYKAFLFSGFGERVDARPNNQKVYPYVIRLLSQLKSAPSKNRKNSKNYKNCKALLVCLQDYKDYDAFLAFEINLLCVDHDMNDTRTRSELQRCNNPPLGVEVPQVE